MSYLPTFNLLSVPEDFVFSLLKLNYDNICQQNFITSNVLFIGSKFENYFRGNDDCWLDLKFEFENGSEKNLTFCVKRRLLVIYVSYLDTEIIMSEDDTFNLIKTACPLRDAPFVKYQCKLSATTCKSKKPIKATVVKLCLLNNLIPIESDVIDVILLNYFKWPRFLYKDDIFSVNVVKYLPELHLIKGYNNLVKIYFKVCEINGSGVSSNGYFVNDTISLFQVSTQNSFIPPQMFILSGHNFHGVKTSIKDFLKPLLPPYLDMYAEKLMNFFHPFMVYTLEGKF